MSPEMGTHAPDDVAAAGRERLVASPQHTLILVGILLAFAALGAARRSVLFGATGGSRVPAYAFLILAEWLLLGYAVSGLKRAGTPLGEIISLR